MYITNEIIPLATVTANYSKIEYTRSNGRQLILYLNSLLALTDPQATANAYETHISHLYHTIFQIKLSNLCTTSTINFQLYLIDRTKQNKKKICE